MKIKLNYKIMKEEKGLFHYKKSRERERYRDKGGWRDDKIFDVKCQFTKLGRTIRWENIIQKYLRLVFRICVMILVEN